MQKYLYFLTLIVILISCDKNETKKANLSIKINGFSQGEIELLRSQNESFTKIKTIQVDGQKVIQTELSISEPEIIFMKINRNNSNSIDNMVSFFVEPTNMTIETDLELFSHNLKVTGSKNQDAYQNYLLNIKKFGLQKVTLTEQLYKSSKNQAELYDKVINSDVKKQLYTINFAFNNRDLEIAPYIALQNFDFQNTKLADSLYNVLGISARNCKYGKELAIAIKNKKG